MPRMPMIPIFVCSLPITGTNCFSDEIEILQEDHCMSTEKKVMLVAEILNVLTYQPNMGMSRF